MSRSPGWPGASGGSMPAATFRSTAARLSTLCSEPLAGGASMHHRRRSAIPRLGDRAPPGSGGGNPMQLPTEPAVRSADRVESGASGRHVAMPVTSGRSRAAGSTGRWRASGRSATSAARPRAASADWTHPAPSVRGPADTADSSEARAGTAMSSARPADIAACVGRVSGSATGPAASAASRGVAARPATPAKGPTETAGGAPTGEHGVGAA